MHFKSFVILSCSLATFASAISVVDDVVDPTVDTVKAFADKLFGKPVDSTTLTATDIKSFSEPQKLATLCTEEDLENLQVVKSDITIVKMRDMRRIRRLYNDLQKTDPIIVQKLGLSQVRKDLGGNEPIIQELGLDKSIEYQPDLLDGKPTKCKELQEQKDLLDRLLWGQGTYLVTTKTGKSWIQVAERASATLMKMASGVEGAFWQR